MVHVAAMTGRFDVGGGSAWQPRGVTVQRFDREFRDWHQDPQEGVHRQSRVPGGTEAGPFMRHPQAQDPSRYEDEGRYPRPRRSRYPQAMDEGYPAGFVTDTLVGRGQEAYNQETVPQRIPRLWEDKLSHWEGLRTHGAGTVGLVAHNNHWFYAHHPVPRYPTRGIRGISGVLAPDGPTASRARIPAVFVPSSVG